MIDFQKCKEEAEKRFSKLETDINQMGIRVAILQENLNEQQRQSDKIEELLLGISDSVSEIQMKISGYQMSAMALAKATTIIFSILAAIGTVIAAAWSLIKDILTDT